MRVLRAGLLGAVVLSMSAMALADASSSGAPRRVIQGGVIMVHGNPPNLFVVRSRSTPEYVPVEVTPHFTGDVTSATRRAPF